MTKIPARQLIKLTHVENIESMSNNTIALELNINL